MIKKFLLVAVVATALGAASTPSQAVLVVQVAPPAPRVEMLPPHRPGYVWIAGHWDWRNHQHKWVKGTWLRERHGFQFRPSTWVERDGRWHMERGAWRRNDRDGDGIPNRVDRRPDDPRR